MEIQNVIQKSNLIYQQTFSCLSAGNRQPRGERNLPVEALKSCNSWPADEGFWSQTSHDVWTVTPHSPGKSLSLWQLCWVLIVIRIVAKTPKWAISCGNTSWARAPLEKCLDHRLGVHTDGSCTDGATVVIQHKGEVRRCQRSGTQIQQWPHRTWVPSCSAPPLANLRVASRSTHWCALEKEVKRTRLFMSSSVQTLGPDVACLSYLFRNTKAWMDGTIICFLPLIPFSFS